MASASYSQNSFLGGEWAKAAQGRFDRPDYRTAMNVCLNSYPVESGAWVRRAGTLWADTTRNGLPGRVVSFNFEQTAPYTIEFTDGFMRFREGTRLVRTNDGQSVAGVSSANPANVQTATAHGWASGDQVQFPIIAAAQTYPLLSRTFKITVNSSVAFTIQDSITGETIDGTNIESTNSGTIVRVREIATPYVGGSWAALRVVQTDFVTASGSTIGAVLLHGSYQPYVLKVASDPTSTADATFTFTTADFKDGPYLDPVPGGALATPSAKVGIIGIALSFNAYDTTKAYAKGDYITYSSVNYKSLTDANLNNTPTGAPNLWAPVNASDALGPKGLQAGDVGRMVRLFSEPGLWVTGTTYAAKDTVRTENPTQYWISLAGSNVGNPPGLDLTKWIIATGAALWTWGKITALNTTIDRVLPGSQNIGDMVNGGGNAAAFDGTFFRPASTCAQHATSGVATPGVGIAFSCFVGKNYSAASDQQIQAATLYPSNDNGLIVAVFTPQPGLVFNSSFTLYLRGSATAPVVSNDGTVLAIFPANNTTAPIVIASSDTTTAWKYVWLEMVTTIIFTGVNTPVSYSVTTLIAQLSFFKPPGTGVSDGFSLQIVGDPLLYLNPIRMWRLGVYSDSNGWPTCGTWHEGRLWLSGVVGNRIDASYANQPFNFPPTAPDGTVTGAHAISYLFNSKDINPVFWMEPDDLGIVCGTLGGEWLVQATTLNEPLTPTTIQAHRITRYGCANVEPKRTELALAVVQRERRKVLEYFADVYRGKFAAQNLSRDGKHLTAPLIAELAYQQELAPIVWQRLDNGALIGLVYKRDTLVSSQPPSFVAAHRHTLGSGRTVESIAAGSSGAARESLAMVTTLSAQAPRFVEVLPPHFEETDALKDARFVDGGVVPPVYVVGTDFKAYGLWHYNGLTVSVVAGGLDLGDYAVANGVVTVPFGDGNSGGTAGGLFTAAFVSSFGTGLMPLTVGFTFNSDGQLVRPATPQESGARNGPALGKKRRNHQYAMLVAGAVTGTLKVGTDLSGTLRPMAFKTDGGTPYTALQLFSGVYWDTLQDSASFDGMLAWRVSRPMPAIVAAVEGFIETQDK